MLSETSTTVPKKATKLKVAPPTQLIVYGPAVGSALSLCELLHKLTASKNAAHTHLRGRRSPTTADPIAVLDANRTAAYIL